MAAEISGLTRADGYGRFRFNEAAANGRGNPCSTAVSPAP